MVTFNEMHTRTQTTPYAQNTDVLSNQPTNASADCMQTTVCTYMETQYNLTSMTSNPFIHVTDSVHYNSARAFLWNSLPSNYNMDKVLHLSAPFQTFPTYTG